VKKHFILQQNLALDVSAIVRLFGRRQELCNLSIRKDFSHWVTSAIPPLPIG